MRRKLPSLLLLLGACSTYYVATAASTPASEQARRSFDQCLREQQLVPCSEKEAAWLREGCARRLERDPTLREDWFADRIHVDVNETDGRLSARFIASPGDGAAAEEGVRKLETCFRKLQPEAQLSVDAKTIFPDVR